MVISAIVLFCVIGLSYAIGYVVGHKTGHNKGFVEGKKDVLDKSLKRLQFIESVTPRRVHV